VGFFYAYNFLIDFKAPLEISQELLELILKSSLYILIHISLLRRKLFRIDLCATETNL